MMRKLLMLGGFAMAMAFMGGTAKADTILTQTVGGYSITATISVTSTSAMLTLSAPPGVYTNAVAIHVENFATLNTATSSVPSGWSADIGQNSSCGGTGSWFCATGPLTTINGLSFTWNFTGGTPTSLDSAQFVVCSSSSTCSPSDNFLGKFSADAPVNTPEPGTLYLLGAGLLPLLFFGRRFLGDLDSR